MIIETRFERLDLLSRGFGGGSEENKPNNCLMYVCSFIW